MGREWGQEVGNHTQTPVGCPENAPRTKGEGGIRAKKQTEVTGKMQQGKAKQNDWGCRNTLGSFQKGLGPLSLVDREPKAQGPERPQMLAYSITSPSLYGFSSLVSVGFKVQNFLRHLISAIGLQESGSHLNQNGRLDY